MLYLSNQLRHLIWGDMKTKLELPIDIELQLLEMGISLVELARDIEKLIEYGAKFENTYPTSSPDFVH